MEIQSVDVWGVCFSRDLFEISPIDGISVNVYYSIDPRCAFMEPISNYLLDYEDFVKLGKWRSRNICADFNRTVLDDYRNSGSKWLILDLRLFTYNLYEINQGDSVIGYCSAWQNTHLSTDELQEYLIKKYEVDISVKEVEYQDKSNLLFKKWCEFLNKRYGSNIIAILSREAHLGNFNNTIMQCQNDSDLTRNAKLSASSMYLVDNLDCHCLILPDNIIADYYHKWGYNPVHYVFEVYDNLSNSINKIISGGDKNHNLCIKSYTNLLNKMDNKILMYKLDVSSKIDDIKKQCELISCVDDFSDFINLYNHELLALSNCEILGAHEYLIGNYYLNGKYVENNSGLAIEWFKKAIMHEDREAKYALCDLYWNSTLFDSELVCILSEMISQGDPWAMNRIGRLFQHGRFFPKNLKDAAQWMRMSISSGCDWAKNELFDVLWEIGTPESYSEMISVIKERADFGDENAMARLGRAYRDGKGVDRNIDEAKYWMNEAIRKGAIWVLPEFRHLM